MNAQRVPLFAVQIGTKFLHQSVRTSTFAQSSIVANNYTMYFTLSSHNIYMFSICSQAGTGEVICSCDANFPGGTPPDEPCRKLFAGEKCNNETLTSNVCSSGLECARVSRSDSSYNCCAEAVRCNVNQRCCNGAYGEGELCPSGASEDCEDGLECVRRTSTTNTKICCKSFIFVPGVGNVCTSAGPVATPTAPKPVPVPVPIPAPVPKPTSPTSSPSDIPTIAECVIADDCGDNRYGVVKQKIEKNTEYIFVKRFSLIYFLLFLSLFFS